MATEAHQITARAGMKAREAEALLQAALRKLEAATTPEALAEAEELAAKAMERARDLLQAASLFSGLVKTKAAMLRRRTLW